MTNPATYTKVPGAYSAMPSPAVAEPPAPSPMSQLKENVQIGKQVQAGGAWVPPAVDRQTLVRRQQELHNQILDRALFEASRYINKRDEELSPDDYKLAARSMEQAAEAMNALSSAMAMLDVPAAMSALTGPAVSPPPVQHQETPGQHADRLRYDELGRSSAAKDVTVRIYRRTQDKPEVMGACALSDAPTTEALRLRLRNRFLAQYPDSIFVWRTENDGRLLDSGELSLRWPDELVVGDMEEAFLGDDFDAAATLHRRLGVNPLNVTVTLAVGTRRVPGRPFTRGKPFTMSLESAANRARLESLVAPMLNVGCEGHVEWTMTLGDKRLGAGLFPFVGTFDRDAIHRSILASDTPSSQETTMATAAPNTSPSATTTETPAPSKTKQALATLNSDAHDAAWRTAATQLVKLTRDPLVATLSRHLGPEDEAMRKKIADFLATEAGTALLSGVLAIGLATVPVANTALGPKAERLRKELSVKAMADMGDLVADVVMGPLRQVMSFYLQGLPTEEMASLPAALPAAPPNTASDLLGDALADREVKPLVG